MGRHEVQAGSTSHDGLPQAASIAQEYLYLPRSRTIVDLLKRRNPAHTERLFENNLQQALELVYQEHDMTELESYYLALFSGLQVRNARAIQGIERSGEDDREIAKQKLIQTLDFQEKLVAADKAFELYGSFVALKRENPALRQPVHDWFVRMRIAGLDVGRSLPLPSSSIGEDIVAKACGQVESKRIPGFTLERGELRDLFTNRGVSDPMVDVIAV